MLRTLAHPFAPSSGARGRLRILALAVLGLAAFTAGCSDSGSFSLGWIRRPRLVEAAGALTEPVTLAVLDPASAELDAVRHERLRFGAFDVVKLYGRAAKSARFELAPPLRAFDRVTVPVLIERDDRLELRLWRDGEQVARFDLPLRSCSVPELVSLDLPVGMRLDPDALSVTIAGEGPASLGRIELVRLPIEARLPSSARGPELVTIGAESRRAVGLSTGRPIDLRFAANEGDVLHFSHGVPAGVGRPAERSALVVELSDTDGREDERRIELASDGSGACAWALTRIPLAAGEWRVRFRLETADGREALCALGQPKVYTPDSAAKTVLFVTSDTHRGDHLGAARGAVAVATPTLDALASQGVLFERCFSSTNVTLPSHVALLTGTHPHDTRLLDNATQLSGEARTLAECFREAGYATVAAVSASHLASAWSGLGQGFDRVLETNEAKRRGSATIDALEPVLDDLEGQPLFVWLHVFDAHMPYEPPEEFAKAYYPDRARAFDLEFPPLPYDRRHVPPIWAGLRDPEYPAALYRGEVSALDQELARVLARPRFEQAIVAFTADHGESLGAHGVYFDHGQLYPDSIHVPLILRWPDAPSGTRIQDRVDHLGIGRTLLDLAGLETIEFPGEPLLDARARHGRDLYTLSAYAQSAAVTSGRWHLMLTLRLNSADLFALVVKHPHEVELYDLDADPGCLHDLSKTETEIAKGLRERLIAWLRHGTPKPWRARAADDPQTLAHLEKLGYVDSAPQGDEPLFPAECACAACSRFR